MINPRKKSKYWVDDSSILPEIVITPQGNYPILDEAGNPARTVGAIQDINPNAHIYERVNIQPFMDDYIEGETNTAANQRADALDAQVVPHMGDFVSAATKPLDALMPSRWVGLLDKDYDGLSAVDRFSRLFDENNRGLFINDKPYGLFSKRYAEEHPYWAMAGNMAFDIASTPFIWNGANKVYNEGKTAYNTASTYLQNNYPALFDPYTSWDATLGYHGDNLFSRAIGTVGRRFGYTPKAEIPEFHRRLGITKPESFRLTDDGKFIMSSGRTGEGHEGIVNFATSEPARSHGNHRYLSGVDNFIVSPKALEGVDFKSIQPSDTFFQMPLNNTEFAIDPKYVTFVSGEPAALDYARSIGMKTLSSPRLRALEADKPTFSGLLSRIYAWKGAHTENAGRIGNEIQRLASMRGAPTMKDYAYFEDITGLNSGVVPASRWTGTNEIDLFGRKSGVRGVPVFNNVAYDPATSIESIYRKAKTGEGTWEDYYEALKNMPSASAQLKNAAPWVRNNRAISLQQSRNPKGYVINDDGTVTFDDGIERTTKATEEASKEINKIAESLVDSPYQNMDASKFPEAKYKYNPRTGEFDIEAPLQTWIDEGEPLVQKYYESPEEYNRMIASGASPEDATLVTTVRALNAENRLPSELVDLGDDIFGQAENINGQARIDYNNRTNSRASNTFLDTLLSTIFHELGGHGSSLNVGYGTQTIPEHMVPILKKIYKHNEALRPKLKPIYLAIKDGDYETAKRLAETENGILKGTNGEINFKEIKDLIDYMEDVQEYSARALGTNMGRHYGVKNNWNTDLLYKYFTKETVDNLLKNVWQVGLPLVGGGTLLYKTLDNNQLVQVQKSGGRILPPWYK